MGSSNTIPCHTNHRSLLQGLAAKAPCLAPGFTRVLVSTRFGRGLVVGLQSPIRSRGRLPVGLGSSNKIPCQVGVGVQANLMRRKRSRPSSLQHGIYHTLSVTPSSTPSQTPHAALDTHTESNARQRAPQHVFCKTSLPIPLITCAPGQTGPSGNACTDCGAGKSSPSTGASDEPACRECAAGKVLAPGR